MTANDDPLDLSPRWRQLGLLAVAVFLAMAMWFSATSVASQLGEQWSLTESQLSWLTMSVQIGFVIGALGIAVLNLADHWQPQRLMCVSAIVGAVANGSIALFIDDQLGRSSAGFLTVIALRMITGVALAGVYPPGMKVMASWFREGRGFAIGVLVGALTIGSASPHLLKVPLERWVASARTDSFEPWRLVVLGASGAALLAAGVAFSAVRPGPLLAAAPKFDWSYCFRMWRNEAVRRANFGYLGHMWELYAMWTWAPFFLKECYQNASWSAGAAGVASFALVAIGGIGCVAAGAVADRLGRTTVTIASLIVSGGCALAAGFAFQQPVLATVICLVWGVSVVADSAQFSTAVTELADARFVGTALTIQTCAGFLLTTVTIRVVPALQSQELGWGPTFAALALGPLFGIYHMARLRWMPEAKKMASGNR
ncbi:MAG: MFS transporter [Pirellulaceae bacterium]|jgi:MFS family permease|nr:MFS transporter [Pirellulaceae bacterium]MDP7016605.1 MFS transporter [Pirellulaceae bacterium]